MSQRTRLLGISLPALALITVGVILAWADLGALALLAVSMGAGLSLGAWVMGIVDAARARHWGWLVVVAIGGVLGTTAYALFGIGDSAT